MTCAAMPGILNRCSPEEISCLIPLDPVTHRVKLFTELLTFILLKNQLEARKSPSFKQSQL